MSFNFSCVVFLHYHPHLHLLEQLFYHFQPLVSHYNFHDGSPHLRKILTAVHPKHCIFLHSLDICTPEVYFCYPIHLSVYASCDAVCT
uniref:Uncharacterized protein n=1 Tax=Lotus japonicus TaxID=34305 RepID=I3T3N6_LOTJA|nr:unknown [Lotus japonicus]